MVHFAKAIANNTPISEVPSANDWGEICAIKEQNLDNEDYSFWAQITQIMKVQ